jgi:glycosyltransferase involved in cell wall biosynthesis
MTRAASPPVLDTAHNHHKIPVTRQRVIINWAISSFSGWGIYGLNLALQWSNDPDIEPMCPIPIIPDDISLDAIQCHVLQPFLVLSENLRNSLVPFATSHCQVECPILTFFDLRSTNYEHRITGTPTIGVAFFESAHLGAKAIERARALPVIVTGSNWNRRVLNEHGLDNVATVLQGTDPTLFHPAPAGKWFGDRFCVFSGGKLEYRKAQDIVLAAFRVFAVRHEEAMLVTAWHSDWPGVARTLEASALVRPVLFDSAGRIDVAGWAATNGIDRDQILDLGSVPNRQMPNILREMDVAVFPNRCEGGTNLVAMECMACGVPVILSRNTGHLDIMEKENCFALEHQSVLDGERAGMGAVPGWGESSVEEVIECLERVFEDRADALRRGRAGAETMTRLTWAHTADRMKQLILDHG